MITAADLSIIIPVAKGETAHEPLLPQLPENAEIIVSSEASRAKSLNIGSHKAIRPFLWFLHADSYVTTEAIEALLHYLNTHPQRLHYFPLTFHDGTWLMKLNAWGLNVRSQWLGMPFGDQGFCMSKEVFYQLGGYDEHASYGEDHLLTWHAKYQGVKLNKVFAPLTTSARKYSNNGWLKTTWQHIKLTYKQAWPAWKKLYFGYTPKNVAIACFVKTPAFSPVKTRLAATIGEKKAAEFYTFSVQATKTVVESSGYTAYFAVAEEKGLNDDLWHGVNTIQSGTGDLGERLHHVYHTLLQQHDAVVLIGADSPQLTTETTHYAVKKLRTANYSIGPTEDGGFYLFAGKKAVSADIWKNVEYSCEHTRHQLLNNLGWAVPHLPTLSDVDDEQSLLALKQTLEKNHHPHLQPLKTWLAKNI